MLTLGSCSYNAPVLTSGGSASLTTTTTGYTGSATASCTNGTVTLTATAASCQKSGPTDADLAIHTQVPPLTYGVESPERLFFEHLNTQRAQCGFGLLAQNTALDRAAKAHTDYIMERILEGTGNDFTAFQAYLANPHIEIQGKSGFTGVSPFDRASVTGYTTIGGLTESGAIPIFGVSTEGKTVGASGAGLSAGMGLLASVYHLRAMMGPYREAGVGQTFGLGAAARGTGTVSPTYMVLAYGQYPQTANTLRSYPCQGSTNVEFDMGGEIPNPYVGTPLFGTAVGHPIYFTAPRSATRIQIESISIEPINAPAGTASYSLAAGTVHLVTQANDPHKRLKATDVFAVATTPMRRSTSYRVQGRVLIDSTAQNVDFTFATGIGYNNAAQDPKYLIPAPK
ncbi:MAG: CAP domain-containing protein [Inhella sp.]|uniref:CAP domain-containing protein n=1 Tax=Inhella sp. TaxID=1921806 RepID=UPI00391F6055